MRRLLVLLCLVSFPAFAEEGPKVVADIAPVRALTAQLMEGVGSPSQIIPTGASPHGYAMRPSEARALRNADLVIWVGPGLTHWLEEPLDTLSGDAIRLTLMEVPQTQNLPIRDATELEEKHEEDHNHDDHDHGQKDHEDHAEHEEDDHADHGHEHHGDIDPHGWLSPANAQIWAQAIADKLMQMDPENAQIYTANLETLTVELALLELEIRRLMEPHQNKSFIVLHDAFQYFEATFGVTAQAFIIPGTGQTPGPARLSTLRAHLSQNPAVCAFTAPQENDALMRTALEGSGTRVAVLDAIGDGQTPYAALIRKFATDMAACLAAE
ncbi:zinc ABC transporter substrate-binding protein [uncultured Sulfitobacter sp.]|uniref:zinc ABC transporter substrate-binding protein n=1 Tax=uncultured Sulfitobacter sp. TaxID=191468 RepID=UPI002623DD8D|nr:zinc ABC transporter substrate-binding protein [uncultured Sulfitobacter sp.]